MGILGKLVAGYRSLGKKVTDGLTKIGSKIKLKSQLSPNTDYHKMTKQMKFQAKIAQLAYEAPQKRPKELEGYKLDDEFNKTYHCVYAGSKVYLAFRGTSPTDLRDLKSDLDIVRGEEVKNERFREALKLADKVHKKYPSKIMYATGHSLGGRLSQIVSKLKSFVKKGIGFNPGCGKGCLWEAFEYASGGKANQAYTTHKVIGDAISASSGMSGGKVYSYPTKGALKSHSIDNFN